jgi:predicted phage terminase large subunit-like protein
MNTVDHAEDKLGEIKTHFERNEKLRRMIPHLLPGPDEVWKKDRITIKRSGIYSEPSIMASSVESDLASLHFDYILGDDVIAAKKKDMMSGDIIMLRPEDVTRAINWYKLTMKGLRINKSGHETHIQFVVNRWGVFDFAKYIMDNHLRCKENPNGFEFLQMAAHKEDGSLLWPSVLTEERLAEDRYDTSDFMYYTQMECRPYNPEDRGFPADSNIYWNERYPPGYEDGTERYKRYALMDIADASKPESCFTSFVLVFIDTTNHIWVSEAVRKKLDTIGKIDIIHHMVRKHNLSEVYIEENLHKDTLKYVLKKAMEEEGVRYTIKPLKHKNRNKHARILRLQPHHEKGALHVKKSQKELLEELRDYPFSPHKDIIDALGYSMDFVKTPKGRKLEKPEPEYVPKKTISFKEMKEGIDEQRFRFGYGEAKNGKRRII